MIALQIIVIVTVLTGVLEISVLKMIDDVPDVCNSVHIIMLVHGHIRRPCRSYIGSNCFVRQPSMIIWVNIINGTFELMHYVQT